MKWQYLQEFVELNPHLLISENNSRMLNKYMTNINRYFFLLNLSSSYFCGIVTIQIDDMIYDMINDMIYDMIYDI